MWTIYNFMYEYGLVLMLCPRRFHSVLLTNYSNLQMQKYFSVHCSLAARSTHDGV